MNIYTLTTYILFSMCIFHFALYKHFIKVCDNKDNLKLNLLTSTLTSTLFFSFVFLMGGR